MTKLQQETSGLTRLFKVVKNAVSGWFGNDSRSRSPHLSEQSQRELKAAIDGGDNSETPRQPKTEPLTIAQVMGYEEPLNGSDDVGEDEVLVAVDQDLVAELQTTIPEDDSIRPREINKQVNEELSGMNPDQVIVDDYENLSDEELERLTRPDPDESSEVSQDDLEAAADFYDAVVANGGTNEGMSTTLTTKEPEKPKTAPKPKPKPRNAASSLPPRTKTTSKATGSRRAKGASETRALYSAWRKTGSISDLEKLIAAKRKRKKSWQALGFSAQEIAIIQKSL